MITVVYIYAFEMYHIISFFFYCPTKISSSDTTERICMYNTSSLKQNDITIKQTYKYDVTLQILIIPTANIWDFVYFVCEFYHKREKIPKGEGGYKIINQI